MRKGFVLGAGAVVLCAMSALAQTAQAPAGKPTPPPATDAQTSVITPPYPDAA